MTDDIARIIASMIEKYDGKSVLHGAGVSKIERMVIGIMAAAGLTTVEPEPAPAPVQPEPVQEPASCETPHVSRTRSPAPSQHDGHVIIYRLFKEAEQRELRRLISGAALPAKKKATHAAGNKFGWCGTAGDASAGTNMDATQSFILACGGMSSLMDLYSR